eukprot:scaffold120598_cov25-Tisochrysis_lutea.AAC.3
MRTQAEVFNGAILQQSFVVDFVVENHMCPDCNRFNANPNSWTACAQVRVTLGQNIFVDVRVSCRTPCNLSKGTDMSVGVRVSWCTPCNFCEGA